MACGIRARRPDLHVFVATGDGDCCSIGAGHWIHAIRYNMKMVVMLLDSCPHFVTPDFEALQNDPTRLTLLSHPDGIELDDAVKATFKNHFEHDPANLDEARSLAERDDTVPVGLFYRNESAARYDEYSSENLATSRRDKLAALREELSHYEV